MRVVCVRFVDPATREERVEAPWLTLDEEYPVLAIDVLPDKRVLFRIESDDDGTPALFDAEMFVESSSAIPPTWQVRLRAGGSLEIAPSAWLRPGFWDEFFDRVPEAVEIYEKVKAEILLHS